MSVNRYLPLIAILVATLFALQPAWSGSSSAPVQAAPDQPAAAIQDAAAFVVPAPDPGRLNRWPAHLAAADRASRYGPQRTDPTQEMPTHAYSPFAETREETYICPSGGCDFQRGRLLIKLASHVNLLRPDLPGGWTDDAGLNLALAAQGVTRLEPAFRNVRRPQPGQTVVSPRGERIPLPDLTRWHRATLADDANIGAIAAGLARLPAVAWAEPDYLRKPVGEQGSGGAGGQRSGGAGEQWGNPQSAIRNAQFTDPLYPQQWHLAATNVPQAWDWLASQGLPAGGSRDIVVAVIDTGVDYNHPDLAVNIWTNSREVAGNGIDDDGNGYVDDVHGADTVTPDGDPLDDHGHGTHVAGIIAAQAGNGAGGVGVAYNVQVMAIKAAQYSGVLATSDIAEGINYAVAQGADVINMLFGGYARSQLEEDALAVAFGQAVLVAAAGNDGYPNEGPCIPARPMYPAAYNWVLGVMASTQGGGRASFSNFDCIARNSIEYELKAPGVDIWSTLPEEQYAAWDGTSMAAPVVSGIAALARTKWSDKDVYSSRFIMGQIAANTQGGVGGVANAYAALTVPPQPQLSYLEHWTFDTADQSAVNDDDGIVDAGETIDLAIVIRNHWGKADPVAVTLEAWATGAFQPDPYVTMITGTVDYGAVGSFNIDDNGLIYDNEGVIIGVRNPFRFLVDPNTPNDHVIPFRLTMVAGNGYDPADPNAPYVTESRFYLIVQRGRELPSIISQDMTLTKDDYWLVPYPVLVQAGAHVTVTEGTQVQFWGPNPADPYGQPLTAYIQVEGSLVTQGTADEPVEFFPWPLYPGKTSQIKSALQGTVYLNYTNIRNPDVRNAVTVDHCYFDQEGSIQPWMLAPTMQYTRFHNVGQIDVTYSYQTIRTTLFDNTKVNISPGISVPTNDNVTDTVFLTQAARGTSTANYPSIAKSGRTLKEPYVLRAIFPEVESDRTYVTVSSDWQSSETRAGEFFDITERFAVHFGGHIVSVGSAEQNAFLAQYINSNLNQTAFQQRYAGMFCGSGQTSCWFLFDTPPLIGLTDRLNEGNFLWISGEPAIYTSWDASQPDNGGCPSCDEDFVGVSTTGVWYDYTGVGNPLILELPGLWTEQQLNAERDYFVLNRLGDGFNRFRDNAFLSPWWDPDPNHWLRISSEANRETWHFMSNNFWGGASSTQIDAAIRDYHDNFDLSVLVYEPVLLSPATTTYPFVSDVVLSTATSPDASIVGAEPVTFTVAFNRDMDTTIQPAVSFGPDVPETDYTVHPIESGWVDPRTWQGTFNITPVTGDGYQLIRVAGAVAADDPWLVTGDDAGRFRFEIITSGTEAMNLQATGGEGYVDLAWTQNDFDLLSGFNLYRSTTQDGSYSRLNTSIISPDVRAWRDTNVTPGQPYYYKFTVVKSDMTESDFSNVATATPLDTIPPVVVHTPVTSTPPGLGLTLYADVTDNVVVQDVILYYRAIGATSYLSRTMTLTTGNRYSATIEGSRVTSPGLEYYIEASDGISRARAGRADFPYQIAVVDRPVVTAVSPNRGPASGGTVVTIAGSNFKAGADVTFGAAAAGDVTVVSSSQITCTTPPHYPEAADVTVTNPDEQSGTLLRGFAFESDVAALGLPDTGGEQHAVVEVPVNLANVGGLLAADLTITFDAGVLQAQGARAGALIPGWSLYANTNTPGQVRLSMASPGGSVTGSGILVYLQFEVLGSAGVTSTLHVASASLNDGAIPVQTTDGSFTVSLAYNVAGAVRYWNGGAGVPGVTLSLAGDYVYTGVSDAAGAYSVTGARRDGYVLTPSKSDTANGISAYDASLVLQHAAGLITLAGDAATAADVNRSGLISSMDASYILQRAVGLIGLPFPGAGIVWQFNPASRSYDDLSSNQTGQDFTAILLGDVSGNWSAGSASARSNDFSRSPVTVRVRNAGASATIWLDPAGAPIYSLELLLTYPVDQAEVLAVEPGPAARGLELTTNRAEPGRIRIAMAGGRPVTQAGALLTIRLRPTTGARPALALAWGEVNEGAAPARLVEGWRSYLPAFGGGGR